MAIFLELHLALGPGRVPVETRAATLRRTEQRTFPSAELTLEPMSGTWIDVHDSHGRTIYRQLLPDPWEGAEVPADEHGTVMRQTGSSMASVQVLLPELPTAAVVVFMSSPTPDAAAVPLLRKQLPTPR